MTGVTTGAAFLRELADMLDTVPGLPEPFAITMQASAAHWPATEAERFAAVHDVAELLRVHVSTDWRGGRTVRYGVGQFIYLVHANPDNPATEGPANRWERDQVRVVTRAQDEEAAHAAAAREVYERGRRDAVYALRLGGALRARGLELSPTTLTTIQGDTHV